MRKTASKLISLLLCLSIVLSMFVIFASAETEGGEDEEVEEDFFSLLYNRDFEEGWGVINGNASAPKNNVFTIDYETDYTFNYNYFMRVELASNQDGYLEYNFNNNSKVGSVIEFDIKCDDVCHMNRIMYSRAPGGNGVGTAVDLLAIKNNYLYVLGNSAPACYLENKWVHCAFVYDFTLEDEEGELSRTDFSITAYVGDQVYENIYTTTTTGLDILRIGMSSGLTEEYFGSSYCIDNLKMYNGVNELVDITDDMGYGSKINGNMAPSIEILGGGTDKNSAAYLAEALAMKIGVNHVSDAGERLPVALLDENDEDTAFGAPIVVDGVIMVPLQPILNYIGYPSYVHPDGEYVDITTGRSSSFICIGKNYATVDGERVDLKVAPAYATAPNGGEYLVIGMDDVETLFPGFYVTYDDMGLIIISEIDNIINRFDNLDAMMDVMKLFVFEYITPEEAYEDVKENTNNFDHPYILTNQEELDRLHAIYVAEEGSENYDPEILGYLNTLVRAAENSYKQYALPVDANAEGKGTDYSTWVGFRVEKTPVMPYVESGGYDPDGGRSSPSSYTDILQKFAEAYAITRDVKYVHCAYPIAIAMGEWLHWGPGHFLNCADAAKPFAIYYDWCYDINVELGYDVDKLAQILFHHGVHQGYLSTTGQPTPYYRKQGDASNYTDRDNNWNAVCTCGMVMAAYAIFDHDEYVPEGSYIVASNLKTLTDVGMMQYAPDGAYVEGTGYWSYGTNNFFKLASTLVNAAGKDYGLMDCWGIDTTCYFAAHTESSDFRTFNFADGSMGSQDTSWFFFVGDFFGDSSLIDIRRAQLKNGKSVNINDLLNYPTGESEKVGVTLDYMSKGLELFTTRSGWDKGAVFAGLISGENNASHHNQIDGASFVYHSGGNVWFMDVGTENYNASGFWGGATRYRYYVMKPEGNNTLALSSNPGKLPYGQELNSNGFSIANDINEYGAYAVFDNTEYFSGLASYWRRGMMLTNDRKTVIIQDEISFANIETVYWFAHYGLSYVEAVELSADGRTAYMTKGDKTLRVSIVSKSLDFKFEIMDCYTFLHTDPNTGTFDPEYALTHGTGVPENDRSKYRKLAIKGENVLSFNVAVAIELIDPDEESRVGYEWTDMANWSPSADARIDGEVVEVLKRKAAKKTDITAGVGKLKRYYEDGEAFGSRFEANYRTLTDIQYSVNFFADELGSSYNDSLDQYMDYLATYDNYIGEVNERRTFAGNVIKCILGTK